MFKLLPFLILFAGLPGHRLVSNAPFTSHTLSSRDGQSTARLFAFEGIWGTDIYQNHIYRFYKIVNRKSGLCSIQVTSRQAEFTKPDKRNTI